MVCPTTGVHLMRHGWHSLCPLIFAAVSSNAFAQAAEPPWVACYRDLTPPKDPGLVGADLTALVTTYRRDGNLDGQTPANRQRIIAWAEYSEKVEKCAGKSISYDISPFAYDVTRLNDEYRERQVNSPQAWKGMLAAGDLVALGITNAAPTYGIPAAGVMVLAHGAYEFSGHEKYYDELKSTFERDLELRLRDETKPPQVVLTEFASAIDSPVWGASMGILDPDARQMVALAVAKLLKEYSGSGQASRLQQLRDSGRALTLAKARAQKVDVEKRMRTQLNGAADQSTKQAASLAKDMSFLGQVLVNDALNNSLGDIERRRLGGIAATERRALFNRYYALSPTAQDKARAGLLPEFLALGGLSVDQVKALGARADRQARASEISDRWRDYRDDASALANIAQTFKIGGPDFVPSLALGATMFDQGSKMMDVAAKAGDLGIGGALGLMSSGSMIISALQAFSARGGGNGEDRQLQALSCQISEVYARLSEKIADSQRQNAQGFSRLDRKIDVLLLAADWNNFGRGIGSCNFRSDLLAAARQSRREVFRALKDGAAGNLYVHRCEEFLIGSIGTDYRDLEALKLDSAQINALAGANGALKDPDRVRNFRFDQAQYFRSTLYEDAYLPLVADAAEHQSVMAVSSEQRRLSLFELSTTPASTVGELDAKLATVTAIPSGQPTPEMGEIIRADLDSSWTGAQSMAEALKAPISVARANAMALGLDRVSDLVVYVDATGRSMSDETNSTIFAREHDERFEKLKTLYRYYAPVTLQASAQETIMTGDFLLPFMARALDTLDCAGIEGLPTAEFGANPGDDTRIDVSALVGNDSRSSSLAACRILQSNPTLRQNLLVWMLRSSASPWRQVGRPLASKNLANMRLSYDLALNAKDRLLLDRILEPARIIPIETIAGGQPVLRFHYRIAGDCVGIANQSDLYDTFRPDIQSTVRIRTQPSVANVRPASFQWEKN